MKKLDNTNGKLQLPSVRGLAGGGAFILCSKILGLFGWRGNAAAVLMWRLKLGPLSTIHTAVPNGSSCTGGLGAIDGHFCQLSIQLCRQLSPTQLGAQNMLSSMASTWLKRSAALPLAFALRVRRECSTAPPAAPPGPKGAGAGREGAWRRLLEAGRGEKALAKRKPPPAGERQVAQGRRCGQLVATAE